MASSKAATPPAGMPATPQAAPEAEARFKELLECLEENPRDLEVLIGLGTTAQELGRRMEAWLYYSRAMELDPTQRFLLPKLRAVAGPDDLAKVAAYERRPESFLKGIVPSFTYPFRGAGLGMLIVGSFFFYGIRLISTVNFFPLIGAFVGVVVFGYLAMWFIDVCKRAAQWEEEPPHWPDPTMWTDLIQDWAKLVSAKIAAFLPVIVMTVYLASTEATGLLNDAGQPDLVGRWDVGFVIFLVVYYFVFVIAGMLYLPMAMMTNSLLGSPWHAWNPVLVVKSILRIPKDYLLCSAVFAGIWILALAAEAIISANDLALFAGPVVTFVEIYAMCVQMRLLGLLYGLKQTRLNWF